MASITSSCSDWDVAVRHTTAEVNGVPRLWPTSLTITVGLKYTDGRWHEQDDILLLFSGPREVVAFANAILESAGEGGE